jgi:hypothetical protein
MMMMMTLVVIVLTSRDVHENEKQNHTNEGYPLRRDLNPLSGAMCWIIADTFSLLSSCDTHGHDTAFQLPLACTYIFAMISKETRDSRGNGIVVQFIQIPRQAKRYLLRLRD